MNYFIRMRDDTIEPVDKVHPFIYGGISLFTWYHKECREFQVIETTTGLLVSRDTTEEEVIKEAKKQINVVGLDKVKEMIIEHQKKTGYIPPKPIQNTMVL